MLTQCPEQLLYTKSHEWLELNGDIATIGITPHAQEQLGDVVFVELPEVGSSCTAGAAIGVIESVKTASDFYSPVTGEIVDSNAQLESVPELINQDPCQQGWICKIRIKDHKELEQLISAEQYAEQIDEG
jgi:glycine cleavage system H protein